MNRYLVLAAMVLTALLARSAQAQEKLAWKFKEGDKFYLEESTKIKQSIKVLGNNEEKEESQTNLVSFQVKKVGKDGIVLLQTIEELKTEVTKGKEDPGAGAMLEKMKGHQFTITLNNKGQITKFEGYEELMGKLGGGDANVEKVLRAVLPADFFKKTSEHTFAMLPEAAVKKGDTWQRTMTLSMGPIGSFKATHTYKFDGLEKGLAVIASTAKLDYFPPKGDGAGLPFKITKGNLKAENAKNRMLFDHQTGRPVSDTGSTTIRGSMTMEILNMEVEVEMHMEQSSVTRVTATKPGNK